MRHPKRSRKATFEKHVLRVAPLLREVVARRSETSPRASLVVFLLKKRPCARGRRRNRVVGLRALAFPLVCGPGGPRGTRRVPPPLWPSVSKNICENMFFLVKRWKSYTLLRGRHATHVTTLESSHTGGGLQAPPVRKRGPKVGVLVFAARGEKAKT